MKIKNLLYIILLFIFSCSTNDDFSNYNDTNFVFLENINSSDYVLESRLITNRNNKKTLIKTFKEIPEYEVLDFYVFYKNNNSIIKYNTKDKQQNTFASLTNHQIKNFSVSPDYKFVAFSDNEDIFILNLQNSNIINITRNLEGSFRLPKWSPDGRSILIRNNIYILKQGEIYPTVTANYKIFSVFEETYKNVEMFDVFSSPSQAKWSPNSKMIVYAQYQTVFTFDINSKQLKRITSQKVVANNPKFSNDGEMISFFSSDLSKNGNNWQNFLTIYKAKHETSEIISDIYTTDLSWDFNSNNIIYSSKDGLFLHNLSDLSIKKIVKAKEATTLLSVNFLN